MAIIICLLSSKLCHATEKALQTDTENIFLIKIMEKYGTYNKMSVGQLDTLLKHTVYSSCWNNINDTNIVGGTSPANSTNNNTTTLNVGSTNISELEFNCLSAGNLFNIHGIPLSVKANISQLYEMSPAIVYQSQNKACKRHVFTSTENADTHTRPGAAEVWGYGFLSVTLINLCAILGIVFLPLMKRRFYQAMLLFMVALAVGTLSGSSLLVLIPEALSLSHIVGWTVDTYLWKVTTVMGGIYLFFAIERILQVIAEIKQGSYYKEEPKNLTSNNRTEHESLNKVHGSVQTETRSRLDSFNMSFQVPGQEPNGHILDLPLKDGFVVQPKKEINIKPVAWMVIFGDGIHNFIDGLSIGAAFSGNLLAGVSVSLAVICEELPHELGDFAILLNAGMSMKQALMYNFLSACMCYLGLVIGIVVGEQTEGSTWIFALAGGMFLYIALVDMLPEVNHAAKVEGKGTSVGKKVKIFLLQNTGFLLGFSIILILAKFSGDIKIS